MIPAAPRLVVRRLLRAAGLVPAGDVDRARQAAAEARSHARAKRDRERAEFAVRIQALEERIESRREQDIADRAERSTLRKGLAFHRERLNLFAAIYGSHLRRLPLQIETTAAAREEHPTTEAADLEARLMHVCPDYAEALARWRTGSLAEDDSAIPVAGMEWHVPKATAATAASRHGLPLDDLATVRQFAVGGVMLDIGAGFGGTSIPRVLLGDFARVYSAESRQDVYRCLCGNVFGNRVRGLVLPDHVSIVGTDGHVVAPTGAAALDLDAWMTRLEVPRALVRFVRVAASESSLEILRSGTRLLPGRGVVWQLELDGVAGEIDARGLEQLGSLIAKHFTHVKELGIYPAEDWRKSAEARRLLKPGDGPRPHGLLLFNLR